MSNLIAIALLASEIWLATDRQTIMLASSMLTFFKVFMTLKIKSEKEKKTENRPATF